MQDTINPDFKLADNFTHTVNFGKVYLITTNFMVDVTTSLNYLNFLRAKVNGLFRDLLLSLKNIFKLENGNLLKYNNQLIINT